MAVQDLFPWWDLTLFDTLNTNIFKPWGWLILIALVFVIPVVKIWWWVLVPIILYFRVRSLYLWWLSWDYWYSQQKWMMLEVVPPKEILAPFTAMEDVFTVIWTIYDRANWREIWCEGEIPKVPFWCSWEIASLEGKIHFYIRLLENHRHVIESALYAHYPEIEISETTDYTKMVSKDIPNDEWDMYGCDFILRKEDAYPIKTYSKFFEPSGERISKEEKRLDPIISLLEDMARLGPGEYLWLQFITTPITDWDIPWRETAKRILNKTARRPTPAPKWLLTEIGNFLWSAVVGFGKVDEEGEFSLPPAVSESTEREMIITPGEREVLTAIEDKLKKPAFKVNIRGIYLAKRESFKSPHRKISEAYFPHFQTLNMNSIGYTQRTRTKVHYLFRQRRKYLRQRLMLRNYTLRFPPEFPDLIGPGNPVFCTEEMATLFHFPTKITGLTAPTVVRVEAKKASPPSNLPTE